MFKITIAHKNWIKSIKFKLNSYKSIKKQPEELNLTQFKAWKRPIKFKRCLVDCQNVHTNLWWATLLRQLTTTGSGHLFFLRILSTILQKKLFSLTLTKTGFSRRIERFAGVSALEWWERSGFRFEDRKSCNRFRLGQGDERPQNEQEEPRGVSCVDKV